MSGKITELHVENIKRIKLVDITPVDDVVIIEGKNRQGKTSVLDSIAYLLGGKDLIPTDAVRKGELRASITATIDGMEITREWKNPFDSKLKVKAGKGGTSPQAWLDGKLSPVSLEVLNFVNMNREDRVKAYKKITGIDTAKLDAEHKATFEQRRDSNRDADKLRKVLESMPVSKDTPEHIDIKALLEDLTERKDFNDKITAEKKDLKRMGESASMEASSIKQAEEALKQRKEKHDLLVANGRKRWDELQAIQPKPIDELETKLLNAEENNTRVANAERRDKITKELESYELLIGDLNTKLETIATEKETKLKETQLPIKGLEFNGTQIVYNGIELEECSQAEKIMVGIALGIRSNPEIRILLVRDGSLLDETSMKIIRSFADKHDFQVWIERVADQKGSAVYIEDGEIK